MWQVVLQYLQIHLCEADEHPGNETLPKSSRNEAHLENALQGVGSMLAEAVDVHGWFGWKEVGQQITVARNNKYKKRNSYRFMLQ